MVSFTFGKKCWISDDPFHTDEARTHNKNARALLIEFCNFLVLVHDVAATALKKAFVKLRPTAFFQGVFMDGWKPQGLTPLVEGSKVASCRNDAIVEVNGFLLFHEHGLDNCKTFFVEF